MKKLSLTVLALLCATSLQANWLKSLFGLDSKEEETAPAASGMDLSAMTDVFSDSIMDYAKSSGDSLLKSLGGDLTKQISSMAGLLGQNPETAAKLMSTFGKVKGAINTTNWTELLSGFSGLAQGKLGESEMASLTKTMELATAFGLQSFLQDTPHYGDVTKAVSSFKEGEYISAVAPLKNLLDAQGIAPEQQAMIDTSLDYFTDLAKSAGADMLKEGVGSLFGG